MKQELLKNLSEEQIAKVKACKSHEELMALAKAEGVELTNEQLEAINGGGFCSDEMPEEWYFTCPYCPSGKGTQEKLADGIYKCSVCGKVYHR